MKNLFYLTFNRIIHFLVFIVKLPLAVCSLFYFFIIIFRNYLFDIQVLKIRKINTPVISIGNISLGGSGKTPLVLELMTHFKNPWILTRGYKSKVTTNKLYPQIVSRFSTELYGDEPTLIASKLIQGHVVIDPNRYRGAKFALEKSLDVDVFILDDGFQHRQLHRDLDVVVFDLDTFVNSFLFRYPNPIFMCLPFGRYREPLSSLKRADYIFISKWAHLKLNLVEEAVSLITKENSKVFYLKTEIVDLKNIDGQTLSKGNVFLFSGLGNPKVFEEDLKRQFPGLNIIAHKVFKDHHAYSLQELNELLDLSNKNKIPLVCTEKDFIKIKRFKSDTDLSQLYYACQSLSIDPIALAEIQNHKIWSKN